MIGPCGYGCGKTVRFCNKAQVGCRRCYNERRSILPGVAPELPTKEEATNDQLRSALNRTLRDLDKAKASKEELVRAVYQAASDAIAGLSIPPVEPPTVDKRKKVSETAIAVLADWQLAKVTETYSTAICEARVAEYAERVARLTEIQRTEHPVRAARVYLLGDLLEGELIFPGQAHRIDASLFRQALVDGPRILANFLRRMLSVFEQVHVVGVIGNHGALGGPARREYHPESNSDAMMYEVTRQALASEKRLTWDPNVRNGERKWYAVDYVGKKGFFLFHGDQIKGGFAGWPWYGFAKKIMGWRMGAVPEPFDYSLSGHFHTPVRFLVGGVTHWGSGSTESSNTYAAEMLAAQGKPSQWLLFCHPERGVTAEYECHLER